MLYCGNGCQHSTAGHIPSQCPSLPKQSSVRCMDLKGWGELNCFLRSGKGYGVNTSGKRGSVSGKDLQGDRFRFGFVVS